MTTLHNKKSPGGTGNWKKAPSLAFIYSGFSFVSESQVMALQHVRFI